MKFLSRIRSHLSLRAASKPPRSLAEIIRPEAQLRWLTPRLAEITPEYIENLLRGALGGAHVHQWELFDLMEDTWPRLTKNLNEVKRAVTRLDWSCNAWAEEDAAPSPEAEERAKFVSGAIWKMRPAVDRNENAFEGTIYDLLDAWGKGTSMLEILWEATDQQITPRATVWVHPMNYGWHQEGWIGLRQAPDIGTGIFRSSRDNDLISLPEDKFLVALCKSRTTHPSAAALLRPLAWWWCAANFSASWLLNFAQIFGLPIRWATYDSSTPGVFSQVCAMLENLGSAAWAAFPQGTTLDLKEPSKSGGGSDSPQGNLLDRADKQCDLLILGQTLTSDVGDSGSRALGEIHSDVRSDIILAAADFAAGIINRQLIPSLLRLNYGDDEFAPEFCAGPNKIEDAKANADRDATLLSTGIELPKAWFYERHGIPLPQKGEETIKSRPPAMFPGQPNPNDPRESGADPKAATDADPEKERESQEDEEAPVDARAAKEAIPDLTRQAVASAAGARVRWLTPLQEELDRLIVAIQDNKLSDRELVEFLDAAAENLPDIFGQLDVNALADALEDALGAAAVEGIRDRVNR